MHVPPSPVQRSCANGVTQATTRPSHNATIPVWRRCSPSRHTKRGYSGLCMLSELCMYVKKVPSDAVGNCGAIQLSRYPTRYDEAWVLDKVAAVGKACVWVVSPGNTSFFFRKRKSDGIDRGYNCYPHSSKPSANCIVIRFLKSRYCPFHIRWSIYRVTYRV